MRSFGFVLIQLRHRELAERRRSKKKRKKETTHKPQKTLNQIHIMQYPNKTNERTNETVAH